MHINWFNPYEQDSGTWYKGSLHNHCSPASPCASMPMENLIKGYKENSYDFISISDHLELTLPDIDDMVMIPGMEWNSRTGQIPDEVATRYDHFGIYSLNSKKITNTLIHRTFADLLNNYDEEILKIANHPNWLIEEHHSIEKLLRFNGQINGFEIYNYTLEFDDGQADATWKWDRLLSMGMPILGFASDDSHKEDDIGHAWLMVKAEEKTAEAIFRAIISGNFYCSTGVVVQEIKRTNDTLSIVLPEEAQIKVIGSQGRVLACHRGKSLNWNFNSVNTTYARLHIQNSQFQEAWSQPFYRHINGF